MNVFYLVNVNPSNLKLNKLDNFLLPQEEACNGKKIFEKKNV